MKTLKELTDALLVLTDAGAGMKLIYCFLRIHFNPDETNSYKRKMVNLGIFCVLATCCIVVKSIIEKYFR